MTTLVRRSPARALRAMGPFYRPTSLIDEVESWAREIFDSRRPLTVSTGLLLKLDVYEKEDELVVKAELPGVPKKELQINLEDDVLTIKAEKKQEETAEDTHYYARGRYFGQYSRSISLPFHVDNDKISAIFKNGLLEIRLPKAEEAKSKQIEVKVQ